MTGTCTFNRAYMGRCGKRAEIDRCPECAGIKCCVCGEPADRECSYAGQFVCGAPLCPNCQGWEDTTKPSGTWGFMNHSHRPRLAAPADGEVSHAADDRRERAVERGRG